MRFKFLLLCFGLNSFLYSFDNLNFDTLFPISLYEQAYKCAAEIYYNIQDYKNCKQSQNETKYFLDLTWNSVLNLYFNVRKNIESGKIDQSFSDYVYLRDLLDTLQEQFASINLADDIMLSSTMVLNASLRDLNRALEKVLSRSCN